MVTFGATFLYAAISGVQPTFASVMDVSFSVTGLPPALALPLSLGPLSWVPLPQAANATATSANPNRADLVIIRALLLARSDFRHSVAVEPRRSRRGKALVDRASRPELGKFPGANARCRL